VVFTLKNLMVHMASSSCSGKVEGYELRLSDDSNWFITTTSEELKPWLKQFAYIVKLESGTNDIGKRLICSLKNKGSNKADRMERLLAVNNGWKSHDTFYLSVWYHDVSSDVLCSIKSLTRSQDAILAMSNLLYPIYRESIILGGQLFHAALIEHEGRGVILAGMHGAGKSTCCSRLPEGWSACGDDEQLVVRSSDGSYRVHSFPTWSEYLNDSQSQKSWDVQHSIPLYGVFFIEQSKIDAAIPIGTGEAVARVSESTFQVYRKQRGIFNEENQRMLQKNLFENTCEMVKSIPAFKLQVTLHGKFWEEIERVLGW
jgi:SynChlorMet cassette protein ScmC